MHVNIEIDAIKKNIIRNETEFDLKRPRYIFTAYWSQIAFGPTRNNNEQKKNYACLFPYTMKNVSYYGENLIDNVNSIMKFNLTLNVSLKNVDPLLVALYSAKKHEFLMRLMWHGNST